METHENPCFGLNLATPLKYEDSDKRSDVTF